MCKSTPQSNQRVKIMIMHQNLMFNDTDHIISRVLLRVAMWLHKFHNFSCQVVTFKRQYQRSFFKKPYFFVKYVLLIDLIKKNSFFQKNTFSITLEEGKNTFFYNARRRKEHVLFLLMIRVCKIYLCCIVTINLTIV